MVNLDFLDKILAHKRKLNAQKKPYFDNIRLKIGDEQFTRYSLFKRQISQPDKINLIAEIKKASPSKGMLRDEFEPLAIANTYQQAGAAAISVLTEDKYFLGKPEYIKILSEKIDIPYLAKDFFIDEGQVIEAAFNGASAILIILAILDDEKAKALMKIAERLDVDCLIEVHNEEEALRAVDIGAEIIGINNRNLHSFEVDIQTTFNLLSKIPDKVITVAESGISTHEHIRGLKQAGVNAVLIGEAFMKEPDIAAKVKEVMHG